MPTSSKPLTITPRGCSDGTPDSGAPTMMAQLSNLVPDPKNKNIWVPRPAALALPGTVAAFTPGFVSALFVAGRYAYGMVSSALNAGHDQPFAYDLVGGGYISITGITSANVPTSPLTTGAWTPPTMDIVGQYVLVTHPGFNGVNGYFGWMNVSNPLLPVWNSGNMATNPLPSPATFVKQFNQRAQFVCAPPNAQPATLASDSLDPLTASFPLILTYDDNKPIQALGVLGLQNSLTGGITQAMFIFKDNDIYQLTGDWGPSGAIGTIQRNTMNVAVGTVAPLSVFATPKGLVFLSNDGFRFIDLSAGISDPIGIGGNGMVIPFTNTLVPSRVCAACNGQTARATTQNNAAIGQPFQEWVFDMERDIWHGPHTLPASLIASYGKSYVMSPVGLNGLWQSDILPTVNSQYTENGVQLTWIWQTSLVANQDSVYEQAIAQSDIYCAGDAIAKQFQMTAQTASGGVLDSVPIIPPVSAQVSLWGTMKWGTGLWGSSTIPLSNILIPWDKPIVFDRVQFTLKGLSGSSVSIGEMRTILEDLEYMSVPG